MPDAAGVTQVTFEEGYEELKGIVVRLDADDVSVHEMCELFARGKGLEKALRGYLTTQQGKLDEIEAGENLPEFVVVAPSAPGPADSGSGDDAGAEREAGLFAADFAPAPPPGRQPAPVDDDLPF